MQLIGNIHQALYNICIFSRKRMGMTYDAYRKEGEHSREYQTVTEHLTGTAAMHPPKSRAFRGRRVDRNVYRNRFL